MKSARTKRRRVSVAITTVLAVTLGAGALTVPATAAPVPTAAVRAAQAPVAFPAKGSLRAAGSTGFVSAEWGTGRPVFQWTRYADGSTTAIDAVEIDSTSSDVVVAGDASTVDHFRVVKLHDMATGGAPVTIDLGALGATYVRAVSRDTVLAVVQRKDGSQEPRLVTRTGGGVTQKSIEGVPAGAWHVDSTPARDGSVLVDYLLTDPATGLSRAHFALVDLATASVVSTHETAPPDTWWGSRVSSFSATHLLWSYGSGNARQGLVSVDRATGKETRTELGDGDSLAGGLVGSWAAYVSPSSLGGDGLGRGPDPLTPFRAKSLTSGETVRLLDYAVTVLPGPDGTLLARGGTVERGEGLYRIAPGADGRPTAELIASTGEPTELVYLGTDIPRLTDLDGSLPLAWRLSRTNVNVELKVTHRRTGKSFSKAFGLYTESAGSPYLYDDKGFAVTWKQMAAESEMGRDAHVGAYDWWFRATPQNGVGPALEASGTFSAAKTSAPHDLKDNGTPDLLARDAQGVLWRTDTTYKGAGKGLVANGERVRVGGGWQVYDRIEAVGDIAVPGVADVVARDRDGVLWTYAGGDADRDATFESRKRIGPGWNAYTLLSGGSDLTRDGRADLVAVDKAGDLWLYRSTGNLGAPFAPRKKIGWNWGVYDRITAVGDVGGARPGDLVARDGDGVLWLYLGKGDGTFAPRARIGAGWNAYADTVGIGDGNGDGRSDLFAYGPGGTAYFYAGTGDWKAPFKPRASTGALNGGTGYDLVF
ncbi:FG-GAP repeat domain-containing protein [Streptomyces sp. NPDC088757]|uniref:FG-GAP repeat domain-containing protein n=1 Tax=Streptomyces sp. NPDC088757 TaxID=3365889 RepID=UPI0038088DD1